MNPSRTALVAGLRVRLSSPSAGAIGAFEALAVHPLPDAGADLEYRIEPDAGDGAWRLARDGVSIDRSSEPENLAALLELDLAAAIEARHPRSGWIHAAAVASPGGEVLLLAGPSGAGKSTAALAFARAGWRYLGDEACLLDPEGGRVVARTTAIRLDEDAPLPGPTWRRAEETWREPGRPPRRAFRVAPPPEACVASGDPAPLAAIAFLERGPGGLLELSPGEALLRLWPLRIRRRDGARPHGPEVLADLLARIGSAALATGRPEDVVPALETWFASRSPGS